MESRILAVKIDSNLFDELKSYLKDNSLTQQEFINTLLREKLQEKVQSQSQNAQGVAWEKDEVECAIEAFIKEYGRTPTQKEFKNENGLPSYNAAGKCLEESPAQYAQRKYEELMKKTSQLLFTDSEYPEGHKDEDTISMTL